MILLNLVLTASLVILIAFLGTTIVMDDPVDASIEATNTLLYFAMYIGAAVVQLPKRINQPLLTGLFLSQNGLVIDFLDEFIELPTRHWHQLGDGMFLVGGAFIILGGVRWALETYERSVTDNLTGLYNRRYFEAALKHVLLSQNRYGIEACLLNIDIDDFKRVNDLHGHSKGDEVLVLVANAILDSIRESDVACRSGGEEFEVFLASSNISNAVMIAERLLENLKQITPKGLPTITASIGVTALRNEDDIGAFRSRADQAMYSAKRNGKAQVQSA